jgi:ABC-type uncharacterized transport system permease subunit
MMTFALIGLAFALIGVAGLQIMYLLYLDRVLKDKKQLIRILERRNRRLTAQIERLKNTNAEDRTEREDEAWAEIID